MLRSLLFFLFGTLLLTGCGADDDVRPSTPLQDSWTWVETSGGIGGMRMTPASTGNQQQIEFLADGTVRYYVNGRITHTDTYTVKRETSRIKHQQVDMIVYGRGERQVFEVRPHLLVLQDDVFDGYRYEYQR